MQITSSLPCRNSFQRVGLSLALGSLVSFAPQVMLAQTAPASTKPAQSHTTTTHKTTAAAPASTAPKLPASIPPAPGVVKTLYALRYIDIKVGAGADAMPNWVYIVHYTGWLYDGTKFDSSVDRGTPFPFVQGQRRVIEGWDTAFSGMKVGGKRRLFIPYQLAYGEHGQGPIPPKSDLIFDVELVDQKDPSAPPPAPPAQ